MFGLYVHKKDGYNVLVNDGDVVSKTGAGLHHRYGVTMKGDAMSVDGKVIARSNGVARAHTRNGSPYVGDVRLVADTPIEVTPKQYGQLLAGEVAAGHKRYDADAEYRVRTGGLRENEETNATFTKLYCPMVSVRHYKARISVGGYINLPYFVDTFYGDSINRERFDDTFTVIIEDDGGNVLYKKTHFAGERMANVGPFNTAGEHWISIRAIDSDGCSSPVQYLDFLVKSPVAEHYFEPTESQMASAPYNIVEGKTTSGTWQERELVWYNNKVGLRALIAYANEHGFNGLRLPSGKHYNISQHKNIASDGVELSYARYFKAVVANGVYTSLTPMEWEDMYAEVNANKYLGYATGGHATPFSGDYMKMYQGLVEGGRVVVSVEASGAKTYYNLDDGTRVLSTDVTVLGCIRCTRISKAELFPSVGASAKVTTSIVLPDGTHYIAAHKLYDNTNDLITLPDGFTLDLNGSTLRGTMATYNLHESHLIELSGFDCHVKNGTVESFYDELCMTVRGSVVKDSDTMIMRWRESNSGYGIKPLERNEMISIRGGRYCTLDNVEVRYSTGYEMEVEYSRRQTFTSLTGDQSTRFPVEDRGYSYGYDKQKHAQEGMMISNFINLPAMIRDNTITIDMRRAWGTSHLFFVTFFDQNNVALKTVKTHKRYRLKPPTGATKCKVSVYGGIDTWPAITAGPTSLNIRNDSEAVNCEIVGCYGHDTKSVIVHPATSEGTLYKDCLFENIGNYVNGWQITPRFADFEEGQDRIDRAAMVNCTVNRVYGNTAIAFHEGRNLVFKGNTNITFAYFSHEVQSCLIEDNVIGRMSFQPAKMYEHPHMVFRRNKLTGFSTENTNPTLNTTFRPTDLFGPGTTETTYNTTPVERTITLMDCEIAETMHYAQYNMRRCKNGKNNIID